MHASRRASRRGEPGNPTHTVAVDPQRSQKPWQEEERGDAARQQLTALLGRSDVVLTFCGRELIFFLWIKPCTSSRGFAHILLRENKLTIEHDKGLINVPDLIC